ncbi:MAG: hypothetical protein PHY73_08660 [Candidatus Omnitrophica bacterium]|nr:hypothetical protein [Candidatus Omnitrophota bacterium]
MFLYRVSEDPHPQAQLINAKFVSLGNTPETIAQFRGKKLVEPVFKTISKILKRNYAGWRIETYPSHAKTESFLSKVCKPGSIRVDPDEGIETGIIDNPDLNDLLFKIEEQPFIGEILEITKKSPGNRHYDKAAFPLSLNGLGVAEHHWNFPEEFKESNLDGETIVQRLEGLFFGRLGSSVRSQFSKEKINDLIRTLWIRLVALNPELKDEFPSIEKEASYQETAAFFLDYDQKKRLTEFLLGIASRYTLDDIHFWERNGKFSKNLIESQRLRRAIIDRATPGLSRWSTGFSDETVLKIEEHYMNAGVLPFDFHQQIKVFGEDEKGKIGYLEEIKEKVAKGEKFNEKAIPGKGPEDQIDSAQTASSDMKGGIDFNAENMNVTTKGDEIDFNIPLDMKNITSSSIEGFVPIIINITPVTDFSGFLGFNEDKSAERKEVRS